MLKVFAGWWLRQMRALLFDGRSPRAPDALIVALDRLEPPLAGALLRREGGSESLLGRLGQPAPVPTGVPLLLRLPPGTVLDRMVTLPLAAEGNIKAALGFELDRLTPFSPEELFWSVGPVLRDPAKGVLQVTLLMIPEAILTPALEGLRRLQLRPEAVEAGGTRIALQDTVSRRDRFVSWPALCAVMAIACLVLPFIRQQIALGDVQALVAARAPAAEAAQRLRAELAETAAGQAAVAAARRAGDPLALLAALTDALPDDTWLSDLTINDGSIAIDGQSGNAARLIGLLTSVPSLTNPSFTAPVTRTSDNKADLFSLRAEVAQ